VGVVCVCVCVGGCVALVIRHATRRAILSSVACPAFSIFPYYLIRGMIFEKRYWKQNVCFDFLYIFCPNWNLDSLDKFSKGTQISNFMKIRPVGAELFHPSGRTDGQTCRSEWSLSAILQTRLKMERRHTDTVRPWKPLNIVSEGNKKEQEWNHIYFFVQHVAFQDRI